MYEMMSNTSFELLFMNLKAIITYLLSYLTLTICLANFKILNLNFSFYLTIFLNILSKRRYAYY